MLNTYLVDEDADDVVITLLVRCRRSTNQLLTFLFVEGTSETGDEYVLEDL